MTASWRGLVVLVGLAVALVIVVAIDLRRTHEMPDRALITGFDAERVTELIWERAGRVAIRIVRGPDGWDVHVQDTAIAPADPGAVGEVLAALRGARWHRRGEAVAVHGTLTVVSGEQRRALGLGPPIEGTEQVWLVEGGRGVVVDRWVARALDRDRLSLRIARPLAEIAQAEAIAIAREGAGELRIEGHPRRLVAPHALVLAAELAGALDRALAAVAIVRVADGPSGARGLAIAVTDRRAAAGRRGRVRLMIGGPCPGDAGLVAVSGTDGDGCVDAVVAQAVERAVAGVEAPAAAIVERRPVPVEIERVQLADGAVLTMAPPRIGDGAADPARVAELLAVLAAPLDVVALPAAAPVGKIVATDRAGGEVAIDLFAGKVLARRGEPVALRPAPGAWEILVRPSRALRDVQMWLEEPTMITALAIDQVRYERGAVIGAWSRRPEGPVDARAVEELVGLLAAPRAQGFVDGEGAPSRRVAIVVTPPAGAPLERVIEIGPRRPSGCPARVDREVVALPARICVLVAALAR